MSGHRPTSNRGPERDLVVYSAGQEIPVRSVMEGLVHLRTQYNRATGAKAAARREYIDLGKTISVLYAALPKPKALKRFVRKHNMHLSTCKQAIRFAKADATGDLLLAIERAWVIISTKKPNKRGQRAGHFYSGDVRSRDDISNRAISRQLGEIDRERAAGHVQSAEEYKPFDLDATLGLKDPPVVEVAPVAKDEDAPPELALRVPSEQVAADDKGASGRQISMSVLYRTTSTIKHMQETVDLATARGCDADRAEKAAEIVRLCAAELDALLA